MPVLTKTKLKWRTLLIVSCILTASYSFAQPWKTTQPYRPYKWMIGVHWNFIDDDGSKFEHVFDLGPRWNLLPYPSKFSVDRYFKYGWSVEVAASYMQYTVDKRIHDTIGFASSFFAFDVNGKYSLYSHYAPRHRWIEPYFTFGLGYANRSVLVAPHTPTLNLGGGINFWPMNRIGIQLAAQAKFALYPAIWDTHANYMHYSAGIVYRSPWKRGYQYPNQKKQHSWTKKQQNFKPKGGH